MLIPSAPFYLTLMSPASTNVGDEGGGRAPSRRAEFLSLMFSLTPEAAQSVRRCACLLHDDRKLPRISIVSLWTILTRHRLQGATAWSGPN